MIKIRSFVGGDEEDYVRVHNQGYSTEPWYGSLEKPLKNEDFPQLGYDAIFLAEVDSVVVGLIDIKIRDKIGDIEDLVVLPKYRGKGIGKALLERAIEFLKGKVDKARIETPIQSKHAIRFYFKNGFRHISNAYLIESIDRPKLEPFLGRNFHLVEDNRYWIPSDEQMELLKSLRADFSVVGEFKVMIRDI